MRTFVGTDDLTDTVRAAFGSDRQLSDVERLRGGSCKGVYRLTLDDGGTTILYHWAPDERFWPQSPLFDVGPFAAGGGEGLGAFLAARARLETLGVGVPQVYLTDGDGRHHPTDIALVEDLPGGTLEALPARDPAAGRAALARLGDHVRAMHADTRPGFGRDGDNFPGRTCAGFVLERGVRCLAEAAAREPRIAAVEDRLGYALSSRSAAVAPRATHGLIHGELGPDHVMIDGDGRPVLIDIEGVMFFDVEWEHAFLELRFGADYPVLRVPGLDEDRLRLYRLVHYLSLVAGPLLLLDSDFPERGFMREIAEANIVRALACLDA